MITMENEVLAKVKKVLDVIIPHVVTLGFKINWSGIQQAEAEHTVPSNGLPLQLQGLCTTIAMGYGDASKPHIDRNDDILMPTVIIQFSGPPGYTAFPQLDAKVLHNIGDVLIAPTSSLLHHSLSEGSSSEGTITAVCFTCRHVGQTVERPEVLEDVELENSYYF